jgi:hypothetical protein
VNFSNTTQHSLKLAAVAALAALGLAALPAEAQPAAAAADETYDWSATLVSYDAPSGTAVLQARFETYVELPDLAGIEAGDRVTLVWTGRMWAAGVRDIVPGRDIPDQALALPVEFVATARDDNYVNFRIHVPESARADLAAFEAGTRLSAISPKQLGSWDSAVISLRHYNDIK